jgi:hypothetical protein
MVISCDSGALSAINVPLKTKLALSFDEGVEISLWGSAD